MPSSNQLTRLLNRPLAVKDKQIPNRLVLAPLSKLGNVAFRELVSQFGGYGLLFSEMSGSRAIPHGRHHQTSGFMWRDGELDQLACQIYGDKPDEMAIAARHVEEAGFFGVDINLGCAVYSVCRHHCGAALLKDPPLAGRIVAAVRKAVDLPVFVKFRIGWEDDPDGAVSLAKRFEDAGADLLTFHPRVAPDRRTRLPKWEYIGRVKQAVSVPVFGNGNVFSASDCQKMMEETGCDGVSLGRLAVSRPWVFSQWTQGRELSPDIYKAVALELVTLLNKYFDPVTALRRFYKFSSYYGANFLFGHTFYSLVHKAKSIEQLNENIHLFFKSTPVLVRHPNIMMLR